MDVRVELRALWFNFFTHIFASVPKTRARGDNVRARNYTWMEVFARARGVKEDANACERDV